MDQNESTARALVAKLADVHIDGRASGGGVHWQVDAGPVGARSGLVHCFWYDRVSSGLMIGVNPSNNRSRLRGSRAPYEGPEYLVILRDEGTRIADGRTRDIAEAVGCLRSWLAGEGRDELVREASFVDRKRRAMQALAKQMRPELRLEIGGDPAYELWVYGEGRSCKIEADDGAPSCSFLLGQAQVARAPTLADVPAAVAAWLLDRLSLSALAARAPEVMFERHAEVLETDPARWHWLHVRDRLANPDDVLAPLHSLIETLAASPIATRFYSYSSLSRFCFSASSHYPWVDRGLPVVSPLDESTCAVGDIRCDFRRAVQVIEAALSKYPVRPFFGAAPHHELPLVASCLARQGSALRPRLVQKGAWYRLVVEDARRLRRCDLSEATVAFEDETGFLGARWPTLDDAVRAVRRYCEDGATLDQLDNESGADWTSRRGPTR